MAKAPRDKVEHHKRYMAMEFGNRPMAWPSVASLLGSGYDGKVSIRNMVPRGGFVSHYPVSKIRDGEWPAPFPVSKARFNQSMPDERLILQGNVKPSFDAGGLWLEYSTTPNQTHRQFTENLTQGFQTSGIRALAILRSNLWPGDFDWMMHLIETYPHAEAIEFSAYSMAVGTLPNSNCVIWEVRAF